MQNKYLYKKKTQIIGIFVTRSSFQLTTVFHKAPFWGQRYSRSFLTIFHQQ